MCASAGAQPCLDHVWGPDSQAMPRPSMTRAAAVVVAVLAAASVAAAEISAECMAKPQCMLTSNYCKKVRCPGASHVRTPCVVFVRTRA